MMFSEIIRLAMASLAANKLRSSLTMLGIAVGVFSVIGVMTVITGLRENIESGLNVLGANSFQITKYPTVNFSDPRGKTRNRRDITYAQAERLRELMGDKVEAKRTAGALGLPLVPGSDGAISDLAELFSISRPTVYRTLERQSTMPAVVAT